MQAIGKTEYDDFAFRSHKHFLGQGYFLLNAPVSQNSR